MARGNNAPLCPNSETVDLICQSLAYICHIIREPPQATSMKKILLALFALQTGMLYGQGIRGVVQVRNHSPLENATVQNMTKGTHQHTNENGFFFLNDASIGDSLQITHIGFSTQRLRIDKDNLSIQLSPTAFQLENVTVMGKVRHLNMISDIDLITNPVNSSQELLRKVPGLFIGQHAGGGKAEQIFLRGFDIDHGTDINITVDGMPVNMVSHAHGQGYADLHFLIPETVEKIDFDKGPYHANKGNLATAGYVGFRTKDKLDNSTVQVEAGKFNTFRTLGMLNLANQERQAAWVGIEYLKTDGFFTSPQNFNRINLTGKYTAWLANNDKISLSLSHFSSKWDASGQIPQRAVDDGSITRFGSIDNTEGGHTGRSNVNLQYLRQLNATTSIKNMAYYSHYDFELYSNFTFFLNDPVNGDQIRQKEKRNMLGFESELNKTYYLNQSAIDLRAAVGLRNDDINDIELSHTANRKTTLEQRKLGDINESNLYAYAGAEYKTGKWLFNPGVRLDYFDFQYVDKLAPVYSTQAQSKSIVSPKFNIIYTQDHHLQYFLKLGKGFHSNDTRVVVAQDGKKVLPAAYGSDLGILWKPFPRLVVNAALWYLYLEQEFVYVGDEAVVEPSGKTTRKGIDLGVRYQMGKYLFFDGDFTYTHARATEEAKGEDYIPLAPHITLTAGLSLKLPAGLNAGVHTRYLGRRPANEDNSIAAKGYTVTDATINYQWKHIGIGIITENIFNVAWNETQFATESRLRQEIDPVTEIHFTPGTPFNIRGVVTFRF